MSGPNILTHNRFFVPMSYQGGRDKQVRRDMSAALTFADVKHALDNEEDALGLHIYR